MWRELRGVRVLDCWSEASKAIVMQIGWPAVCGGASDAYLHEFCQNCMDLMVRVWAPVVMCLAMQTKALTPQASYTAAVTSIPFDSHVESDL